MHCHCLLPQYLRESRGIKYYIYKSSAYVPVPLLRTLSANRYELAFVVHRTAPYWYEVPRISSLPLSYLFAGQYECFEMLKTFVLALRIEVYLYCVVLHCRTSYLFVSVPVGTHLIIVHSYRFIVHSHWCSPPVCCDSVRCNTTCNDRIVVLDRSCLHWFM